jgi:cation diffusion facilitator CzcD-associated flavoprotein CzcO
MLDFCIIGGGVTGLGLLLLLQSEGYDLSKVAIVDPHFDGGDLARKWTTVQSNTPWVKTHMALTAHCPGVQLPASKIPAMVTTPLVEIANYVRQAARPALASCGRQVQGLATRADWNQSTQLWSVTATAGGKTQTFNTRRLVLAQGAEPRSLDLPIPSIPLEVAIDQGRIGRFVRPGQRVLVFGTMHSGTLVIRNAAECGAIVTGYYASPEPFYWDRDGAYDGIKEEAAEIADAIVAGTIPVTLVPVQDTSQLLRTAEPADWVVYAMGFQPRMSIRLFKDGGEVSSTSYDGATGALKDAPSVWGFGTAYPNRAPDGVHLDVSVAAFLSHMKRQLPTLLRG